MQHPAGHLPHETGQRGMAVPGIHPIILDDEGKELPRGAGKAGNICIQNPWPGMFQTIWGDRDRFVTNYFERYCKNPKSTDWRDWPYLTGDAAVEAPDGYYRILGRIDDVINVSGHRLGTKELESAASGCGRGGRSRRRAGQGRHQRRGSRICTWPSNQATKPVDALAKKIVGYPGQRNRSDCQTTPSLDRTRHAQDPFG